MRGLKLVAPGIYSQILLDVQKILNHTLFQHQWDSYSFYSAKNVACCISLTASFKVALNSSSFLGKLRTDNALSIFLRFRWHMSALMGPCIAIMGLESSEPDVAKVDLLS